MFVVVGLHAWGHTHTHMHSYTHTHTHTHCVIKLAICLHDICAYVCVLRLSEAGAAVATSA